MMLRRGLRRACSSNAGLMVCLAVSAASLPAQSDRSGAAGAPVPAPRAGQVMASAGPGGGVFLFGGQIDTVPRLVDSLWHWTGSTWRMLSDRGPSNRTLPAATFDTRRNVLVVHGGSGLSTGTRFGDTWEWDGHAWAESNVNTPGARDHHAMAYDEARGTTVMYGGEDAGANDATSRFPSDTWTWDGSRWTRITAPSGGPGGLVHHAMAYDSRRQRVVLFGGFAPETPRSGDTWEWNGAGWDRDCGPRPPLPSPDGL